MIQGLLGIDRYEFRWDGSIFCLSGNIFLRIERKKGRMLHFLFLGSIPVICVCRAVALMRRFAYSFFLTTIVEVGIVYEPADDEIGRG